MINVKEVKGKKQLLINGSRIHPDDSGQFSVSYEQIQKQNLNKLPDDSRIIVTGESNVTQYFSVRTIHVVNSSVVRVTLDDEVMMANWPYSFSLRWFTEIADALLRRASSGPFIYNGLKKASDWTDYHEVTIEVANGDVRKIEQDLREILTRILGELTELVREVEGMTDEHFGQLLVVGETGEEE